MKIISDMVLEVGLGIGTIISLIVCRQYNTIWTSCNSWLTTLNKFTITALYSVTIQIDLIHNNRVPIVRFYKIMKCGL